MKKDDWRYDLGCQLEYSEFTLKEYKPLHINKDHDHCGFCTKKFSENISDALKIGWQTMYTVTISEIEEQRDSWVCEKCFENFYELLNLRILD